MKPAAAAAFLLVLLVAPGCLLDPGADEADATVSCAAVAGDALAFETNATYVEPVPETVLRVDEAGLPDGRLSLEFIDRGGRTLRHLAYVGDGGVRLLPATGGERVVRVHLVVQPTDQAVPDPESPRLLIHVEPELEPGAYRLEACIQDVTILPPSEATRDLLAREFRVR